MRELQVFYIIRKNCIILSLTYTKVITDTASTLEGIQINLSSLARVAIDIKLPYSSSL